MKRPKSVYRELCSGLNALKKKLFRAESVIWLLIASLLLLPVATFQSIAEAKKAQMLLQAREISSLTESIRTYYADNVVARLQAADGKAVFSDDYRNIHGGIPIPATLSIELGALFDRAHTDGRVSYGFMSDYPFAKRASYPLDNFEQTALKAFRNNEKLEFFDSYIKGSPFQDSSRYRFATPVRMRQACVTCHNQHPDSTKRDWRIGDVRGIQEVTIRSINPEGFGNLTNLFAYIGFLGATSLAATAVFHRQSKKLMKANNELRMSGKREAKLSEKLAKQLEEISIFGSVVDDSIVGISIADMSKEDQPIIYVNKAFTQVTGYTKEMAIGYNCRYLQGPETQASEIDKIRQALRQGLTYSGKIINYRNDGSKFWNMLTLYPIRMGDSRKPDYYVANQVDITSIMNIASENHDKCAEILDSLSSLSTKLSLLINNNDQQLLEDLRKIRSLTSSLEIEP